MVRISKILVKMFAILPIILCGCQHVTAIPTGESRSELLSYMNSGFVDPSLGLWYEIPDRTHRASLALVFYDVMGEKGFIPFKAYMRTSNEFCFSDRDGFAYCFSSGGDFPPGVVKEADSPVRRKTEQLRAQKPNLRISNADRRGFYFAASFISPEAMTTETIEKGKVLNAGLGNVIYIFCFDDPNKILAESSLPEPPGFMISSSDRLYLAAICEHASGHDYGPQEVVYEVFRRNDNGALTYLFEKRLTLSRIYERGIILKAVHPIAPRVVLGVQKWLVNWGDHYVLDFETGGLIKAPPTADAGLVAFLEPSFFEKLIDLYWCTSPAN